MKSFFWTDLFSAASEKKDEFGSVFAVLTNLGFGSLNQEWLIQNWRSRTEMSW